MMRSVIAVLWLGCTVGLQAATVSGRVAVHGSARAMSEIQVSLRYAGAISDPAARGIARRAEPAEDDSFTFADVQPGVYVLEANGTGIMRAQWGAKGPELAGQALVVHTADVLKNLVIEAMARPVLCGQVFGFDGKPLAGAHIVAFMTSADGKDFISSSADGDGISQGGNATADDKGRYRLDRMKPGYYKVSAAQTYPGRSDYAVMWKDATDIRKAAVIDLQATGAPDNCRYDLHLLKMPDKYTGARYVVEGALERGAVPQSSRNLEWKLTPLDQTEYAAGYLEPVSFDPAAPTFTFSNVAPGRYRLTLAPVPYGGFSGSCMPFERNEVSQEIAVNGDTRGIRAEMVSAATVRGKIDVAQTTEDVEGSPEPGLFGINLLATSGLLQCVRTTTSDGSFNFNDLDPMEYSISVENSHHGAYMARLVVNGVQVHDDLLHLKAGENTLQLTERFDAGMVDATIDARLVDGSPARDQQDKWLGNNVRVNVFDERGRRAYSRFGLGGDCNCEGEYRLTLPPGKYTAVVITLEQERWDWNEPLQKVAAPLETSFEIKPSETTHLVLPDKTIELQNLVAKSGMAKIVR